MENLARTLWTARTSRTEIKPLTLSNPDLDAASAYSVMWQGIRLREEEGEEIIGYKMGLTSKAKREQMNLKEPIYGVLTDLMHWDSDDLFPVAEGIHPKAEPEIAFHLGRPLHGVPTPEEAFEACDLIAPAIEILDSRFEGFKYFSLPDVIADNSSSSYFVIGEPLERMSFKSWEDLGKIQMQFYHQDKLLNTAAASEISGNPILSLVALCELLTAQHRTVPGNTWILAGAATPACAMTPESKFTLKAKPFEDLTFSCQ